MLAKSLLQKRILHHREQWGGERQRQTKANTILKKSFQHIYEWQVTVDNRFEEPTLF
ncbi:hypothetical protein [Paenibacillus sp. SYP-B3998]|uniref:hypothetical protein n=1 Tax=Paenibacillus sp. SYP-B3998 TaxID=2678564 RepID=UPI001F0785A0|nr:hypothetical protein [Paenibacillus sp. SYP-B3998]